MDLFSGCGGLSLGFEHAGLEVVGAFDNWAPAVEIYRANFSHEIHEIDIGTGEALSLVQEMRPDVIAGGPPCQDYSISGKRQLGDRANLTLRFGEIVASVRPKWVVFENVYNIERFETLPKLKAMLRGAGYGLSARVLDASRCGVPQKRNRYFLIGKLSEPDGFLNRFLDDGLTERQLTVREYMGSCLDTEYYYMHPRSYSRRAVFSVDEPSATIRGINRPIPQNYKKHGGDKADVDAGVRALTTRERSRIQTFPASFKLPGKKTNIELAIGNAVPPNLAEYIARAVVRFTETPEVSNSEYELF
ncbi:DNA cytosine methyltransferase [Brevibacterium sp. FAM 27836]|uniref:DNA cytosine methyltransferase n=1 Tax=Brevibacterium sp. FAM 27836 TaxID=3446693 RepID=UPI003F5132D2